MASRVSEQDEYLFIDSHDHASSEVAFMRANDPTAPPKLIATRRKDVEYGVSQFGKTFLIVTNANGAEDFELVMAPIDNPAPENWQAAHRASARAAFARHRRHRAPSRLARARERTAAIWIAPLARGSAGPVMLGEAHSRSTFDEEAYALGMSSGYEFDTDRLRFTYASPTTPAQVWDYNMIDPRANAAQDARNPLRP